MVKRKPTKAAAKKEITLGARIRLLRREKEWSQDDLAKKIGAHWQTIGLYEKNSSLPSAPMLKKIADALGVTADYLLTGDEETAGIKIANRELLKKFQQVDQMDPDRQEMLLKIMDMFIRDHTTKEAFSN